MNADVCKIVLHHVMQIGCYEDKVHAAKANLSKTQEEVYHCPER